MGLLEKMIEDCHEGQLAATMFSSFLSMTQPTEVVDGDTGESEERVLPHWVVLSMAIGAVVALAYRFEVDPSEVILEIEENINTPEMKLLWQEAMEKATEIDLGDISI